MKQWLQSLEQRERIMVGLAAAFVVVFLFYLIVWQPLTSATDNLTSKVNNEQNLNTWIKTISTQAQHLRNNGQQKQPEGQNQSLLSVVDQTSRKAGLANAVQRIRPGSDGTATINLNHAGFNKLLYWLYTLQQRYGVTTTALTVSGSDKPGTVQARLSLQRDTT